MTPLKIAMTNGGVYRRFEVNALADYVWDLLRDPNEILFGFSEDAPTDELIAIPIRNIAWVRALQ